MKPLKESLQMITALLGHIKISTNFDIKGVPIVEKFIPFAIFPAQQIHFLFKTWYANVYCFFGKRCFFLLKSLKASKQPRRL